MNHKKHSGSVNQALPQKFSFTFRHEKFIFFSLPVHLTKYFSNLSCEAIKKTHFHVYLVALNNLIKANGY
jgi:hypothetical protein